jgi:hypothetical protein
MKRLLTRSKYQQNDTGVITYSAKIGGKSVSFPFCCRSFVTVIRGKEYRDDWWGALRHFCPDKLWVNVRKVSEKEAKEHEYYLETMRGELRVVKSGRCWEMGFFYNTQQHIRKFFGVKAQRTKKEGSKYYVFQIEYE